MKTAEQKIFSFYERNGGYADLSADSPFPHFAAASLKAGIVAQSKDELQEIRQVLQQLGIDCGSVFSGQGKLVQEILGDKSIRLFKKIIDEVADSYVFQVPEKFAILDFMAEIDFKTESSAGFRLIVIEDMAATEKRLAVKDAAIWFGWLDVHKVVDGSVKVQIRVGIDEKYEHYRTRENLEEIVQSAFKAFGIPADETFEIHFIVEKQSSMGFQYQDRWGTSQVIVD